jgi:hypothetical protein
VIGTGVSYNESVGLSGNAVAKSSSGLFAEPPIPDWRKRQDRLNWHHANFDCVTAAPAQPIAATVHVHTSGIVGRTFREGIGLCAHASLECTGVRLRESPLGWQRRRQILLDWLRRSFKRLHRESAK